MAEQKQTRPRSAEILAAATEVFRRRSYAGASVQEIADAVGLLKGSLYYYIDGKEDLLAQIVSEVHDAARELLERIDEMDVPPLEKLRQYVLEQVRYNLANHERMSVYNRDYGELTEPRLSQTLAERRGFEELIVGHIVAAQRAGEIDASVDPKLSAYFILGSLNWLYTWYDPKGSARQDDIAELFTRLALHGLSAAPAP